MYLPQQHCAASPETRAWESPNPGYVSTAGRRCEFSAQAEPMCMLNAAEWLLQHRLAARGRVQQAGGAWTREASPGHCPCFSGACEPVCAGRSSACCSTDIP